MINFDGVTKENIKELNPNWPQIPDHPYKMFITGGSESGKTNALLNLINQKLQTDQIYLNSQNLYEAKHQFLINEREGAGLKHCNDSIAFIQYLNDIDYICDIIEQYNLIKQRKIFIVFYDMIADMLSNKKLIPVITNLFIRGGINISLVFIK